jgi:nucleoside-diphosphate-sugar epimerase
VTGASGHIGREVCRILRLAGKKILPVDVNHDTREDVIACDLRSKNEISRVFQSHPVQTVIHLAAILPSAFQSDPLLGADVNLSGCFELMRQAEKARINRFIFASSTAGSTTRRLMIRSRGSSVASPSSPVSRDSPRSGLLLTLTSRPRAGCGAGSRPPAWIGVNGGPMSAEH